MNELDFLTSGDWDGALMENRKRYDTLFDKYLQSRDDAKVLLIERLSVSLNTGMQLSDLCSRMNHFLGGEQ